MYSQANVRVESVLRSPTRALPSVIVDTEKVLREADGPTEPRGPEASNAWWVERCSPRGAPQNRTVRAGRSPKNTSAYAVFTEQGSSASQMTAAKIMDIISRLLGCDGQAADAVSACTQVKMEDAHKLLKIPKSECPDIWIRLPRHKWPKSWCSMEDPVVPLERNLYGHPLAGL